MPLLIIVVCGSFGGLCLFGCIVWIAMRCVSKYKMTREDFKPHRKNSLRNRDQQIRPGNQAEEDGDV